MLTASTTIEITLVLSIASCVASILFGVFNVKSINKKDLKASITETSTIVSSLSNIENNIKDIKNNITGINESIRKNEFDIKELQKKFELLEQKVNMFINSDS